MALASIAFCSEALQGRLADYLRRYPQETEVVTKYLSMIQQEAFRCKEITGKLLEFSRVGDRRREPTELAGLIQSVLEIAQHLQNCRGKRILFQPYTQVTAGVNAQESRKIDDKFYDSYFLANTARAPAGDRCAVTFWNLSGQGVTLTVGGQDRSLAAGQNVRLELKREFTWSVTGRDAERQQVPANEVGVEIVLRR